MLHTILQIFSFIFTFLFGSIFTILFLDIKFTKRNLIGFLFFSVVSLSLQILISFLFSPEYVYKIYPLLVHIPLILLCIFKYHKSFFPTLCSLLNSYFLTIPRYMLANILNLIFPKIDGGMELFKVLSTIPIAIISYKLVVAPVQRCLKRSNKDIFMFFLSLALIYVFTYILHVYTGLVTEKLFLIFETSILMFFGIIICYMQIYFVTFDDNKFLELQNQLINTGTRSIKSQEKILKKSEEKLRELRHDMRHYNQLIHEAAIQGETQKIIDYTSGIDSSLMSTVITKYCQNTSINLILSAYINPFMEKGIPVDIVANIPYGIPFSETDICIILANALENAYNESVLVDSPFVSIHINLMEDKLFIKILNACRESVTFKSGIPLSKSEGHGFGTKSTIAISNKYHGLTSYECENNVFTLQVVLHSKIDPNNHFTDMPQTFYK